MVTAAITGNSKILEDFVRPNQEYGFEGLRAKLAQFRAMAPVMQRQAKVSRGTFPGKSRT